MSPPVPRSPLSSSVPPPPFRWSTRVGLPIGLLAAFFAILAGSLWSSLEPVAEVRAIEVVEKPASGRAPAGVQPADGAGAVVQSAGWIEPDPFPTIVGALTDGTVAEVLFLEGDVVKRGDAMARLVADDARLELRRAMANLDAAEQDWQANITNQRDVAVADAAVDETSATLALAQAELEAEQVLLAEAERTLKRREALAATGAGSDADLTAAGADVALRAARTRAATRRIAVLEAEHRRVAAEARAARQRAELRTEERRQLDLARVEADQARLRVERLVVSAPVDGVVMRRLVEPGARVVVASDDPAAAHVAMLYDPARLQVRVDVPLADAARVSAGMRADVVVEILPEATFAGKVTRLGNRADIQKNTLPVHVALEAADPRLKPDMLARVRFLAAPNPAHGSDAAGRLAVFAPHDALDGDVAWVVAEFDGQGGIARRRVVATTGATDGDWREVASGLRPGDLVIVGDRGNIIDGQRVRVRAPGGE